MNRTSRVFLSLATLSLSCTLGLLIGQHGPSGLGSPVRKAQAFGDSDTFETEPGADQWGGGGRFFTGSLRDGLTCGVCHQSQSYFDIGIEGLGEVVEPGKTYDLTIKWDAAPGRVAFNAEIVGPKGFSAGKIEVPPEEEYLLVYETKDSRTPFALSADSRREKSEVSFKWTANQEIKGSVSVHISAVLKQPDEESPGDKNKNLPEGAKPFTETDDDELAVFATVIPLKNTSSKDTETK